MPKKPGNKNSNSRRVPSKIISIHLPYSMLERIDYLVLKGVFLNRSDAIRHAIALLLREYERRDESYRRVYMVGMR